MARNRFSLAFALAAAAMLTAAPALAQNAPVYRDASGRAVSSTGVILVNPDGTFYSATGGGGGGGGAADGVAQGSSTSGQFGVLTQCAVQTAAPTLTNGQTRPCSLTTDGRLRVETNPGGTQPISASSLPLPTGAATESTVAGNGTTLTAISGKLPASLGAKAGSASLSIVAASDGFNIGNITGTISLPTGSATATNQVNQLTSLGTISTALGVAGSTAWLGSGTGDLNQYMRTVAAGVLDVTPVNTNHAQVNGTTVLAGNGPTGLGAQRFTIADDNSPLAIRGDTVAGAAASTRPVGVGGLALTADPTAVDTGDRVDALHDVLGKQITIPALRGAKKRQTTTITASSAETTIITAGASGVFRDVYGLHITNTSATDITCSIRDTTGGTSLATYAIKAGTTGGFNLEAGSALAQTTAASNWTAACTSVTSVVILAMFVETKA